MQKELTTIEAALRGHNIILTATDAEGEETRVTVPCEDIHEIYGQSCPKWMEENGDRESSLWELFNAVAGIGIALAD
jgi:hypothetical protein